MTKATLATSPCNWMKSSRHLEPQLAQANAEDAGGPELLQFRQNTGVTHLGKNREWNIVGPTINTWRCRER